MVTCPVWSVLTFNRVYTNCRSAIMEKVEDYVNKGNTMQRRDAQDIIDEFCPELKKMRGKCLDIGSGPGDVTKEMLLPILPHDAEIIGK